MIHVDSDSTKVLQEFVYFDGKIRHQPFSVTQLKREESKEPKVCNIEDYWNSETVEYVEQMEFGETWEFADINTGLSAEYKDSIE